MQQADKSAPEGLVVGLGCAALAIFALQCFFGFKLQKLYIALAGAFIGFAVGAVLGFLIFSGEYILPGVLILGLLLAVAGGFVAFRFYAVSLALMTAVSTFSAVFAFVSGLVENKYAPILVALTCAAVVFFLTFKFRYVIIILATSFGGAFGFAGELSGMTGWDSVWGVLGIGLALFVLGMVVQFKTNRRAVQ